MNYNPNPYVFRKPAAIVASIRNEEAKPYDTADVRTYGRGSEALSEALKISGIYQRLQRAKSEDNDLESGSADRNWMAYTLINAKPDTRVLKDRLKPGMIITIEEQIAKYNANSLPMETIGDAIKALFGKEPVGLNTKSMAFAYLAHYHPELAQTTEESQENPEGIPPGMTTPAAYRK